jgi:hypothetical protein
MCSLRTSGRPQRLALKKGVTRVYGFLLAEVSDMIEEEQNRNKRLWVHDWIGRRDSRGASTLLLKELAAENVEYKICLRMTPEKFDALLNMIAPKIERQNTQMRDAISPRVMLKVTLYFMATGNGYRTLQYFFRVSKASVSNFIPEVSNAIYDSLHNIPQTFVVAIKPDEFISVILGHFTFVLDEKVSRTFY